MNPGDLRNLLERVRSGALEIDQALSRLAPPVADLGFAQVDLHRRDRCGFPEVLWRLPNGQLWAETVCSRAR